MNKPAFDKKSIPKGKIFKRVLKMLFEFYPVMVPVTIFCILFVSCAAAVPDVYIQRIVAIIEHIAEEKQI